MCVALHLHVISLSQTCNLDALPKWKKSRTTIAKGAFPSELAQTTQGNKHDKLSNKRQHTIHCTYVRQGTEGPVRPATPTVLRNVLVERVRQVRDAVDVAPIKGVGKVSRLDIGMRQGRGVVVVHGIFGDLSVCDRKVRARSVRICTREEHPRYPRLSPS